MSFVRFQAVSSAVSANSPVIPANAKISPGVSQKNSQSGSLTVQTAADAPLTASTEQVLAGLNPDSGERSAVRWQHSRMPLTLCWEAPPDGNIVGDNGDDDWGDDDWCALVLECLHVWQSASVISALDPFQPQVRFGSCFRLDGPTSSGRHRSTDIAIHWETAPTLGRENETGHTQRYLRGEGFIDRVEITLIQAPAVDRFLSPAQREARLKATLLHELGHALGLEHGVAKIDVMHHQGWRNTELSPGDIAALHALYGKRSHGWG